MLSCAALLEDLGWNCVPRGDNALRLLAPFTIGDTGHRVVLYLIQTPRGVRYTDGGETLMVAETYGAELTASRLRHARAKLPAWANLTTSGELEGASGDVPPSRAVADLTQAVLVLAEQALGWRDRAKRDPMEAEVGRALAAVLGSRLKRRVTVKGGSGHQMSFPFFFVLEQRPAYVQTVGAIDQSVNWAAVYAAHGKMADLKQAGELDSHRIVILEDKGADARSVAQATTLLSDTARVVQHSKLSRWLARASLAA